MKNQRVSSESEGRERSTAAVPIPAGESELASRLRTAIGDESQAGFARRAGVGESLLRQYLAGAMPSTDRLVLLADAANVSIEWLAAGRGPKPRGAAREGGVRFDDLDRLRATVEAVENGLQAINRRLPPDKYAQLVAAAYRLMTQGANSRADVIQFIKAAA